MTELPRKAVARTARLAALPLGYAGRNAIGLGKRLGGRPAEAVMSEIQQRTAEQLFRTLGELKGGAMKFGQAMSVLEAALPDELVAPYRTRADPPAGLRSPDADADRARPDRAGPGRGVARRPGLARRRSDSRGEHRPGPPGPLAGRPRGGGQGAVPRRGRRVAVRPPAARAVRPHDRPARPGRRGQAAGRGAPGPGDRRARLRPGGRGAARLRRRLPRRPRHRGPRRRRGRPPGAGDRVAGEPGLAGLGHRRGHPGGARPLRRALRPVPVRRTAADRDAPRRSAPRATSGSSPTTTVVPAASASSTSARSRGCPTAGSPRRWAG